MLYVKSQLPKQSDFSVENIIPMMPIIIQNSSSLSSNGEKTYQLIAIVSPKHSSLSWAYKD